MIQVLENEYVKASFDDTGAELISLINLETGDELLWQADPKFWKRHSPLLFPNVGRQFNDQYKLNGKTYASKLHGFARDSVFNTIENAGNTLCFALESNASTKVNYPFDFSLGVDYTLDGKTLQVNWKVKNLGENTMYFTIGGHPAFCTDPKKSDYCLYFPGKEDLNYKLLNTDYGCVAPGVYVLPLKNGRLALSDEMFEADALIFDDAQITDCILETKDGKQIVEMHTPDFPYYGIWSKPGAPFVCLEPWCGRADNMDFDDDISKKPGIVALEPNETFTKGYSIEVL